MALAKRTGISKKKAEKPEPETTICVAPETVPTKDDSPRCANCLNRVWSGILCYTCTREKNGYVFDETKKVFVKKKGK